LTSILFLRLAEEAILEDDYDLARRSAQSAARRAKEAAAPKIERLAARREAEIGEIGKARPQFLAACKRLEADPADAEANREAGRFLALSKGRWEDGLANLSLAGEGGIALQAGRDLARPSTAKELKELGDAWWDLAQEETGALARKSLEERAAWCYGVVLNDSTAFKDAAVSERWRTTAGRILDRIEKDAVLWMTFDQGSIFTEGGKTYVRDASGCGNDAEIVKAEVTVDDGLQALHFPGRNARASVSGRLPGKLFPALGVPRTVVAWVKVFKKDEGDTPTIFSYGDFNFCLWAGRPYIGRGSGYIEAKTRIWDGNWHFVAGIYGGAPFHELAIFVDGISERSCPLSIDSLHVGRTWKIATGSRGRFKGLIHHVALFHGALSDEDIGFLYRWGRLNRGAGPKPPAAGKKR
jgi:hypothetical protein